MAITFKTGPNVRLTYTADDWQLYGDANDQEYRGREAVARKLNRGLAQRIKAAPTRADFRLGKLLFDHRRFGADDSEGDQMVEDILDAVYPR